MNEQYNNRCNIKNKDQDYRNYLKFSGRETEGEAVRAIYESFNARPLTQQLQISP